MMFRLNANKNTRTQNSLTCSGYGFVFSTNAHGSTRAFHSFPLTASGNGGTDDGFRSMPFSVSALSLETDDRSDISFALKAHSLRLPLIIQHLCEKSKGEM